MYALILWVDYRSTSIVKVQQLLPEKGEGQTTMARYDDGKLYKAKIVKKSDDEHFLSLLTVSTDGEVLEKKNNAKKNIAYSERTLLKAKDKLERQKQEHKKQSNNELLLHSKAIFDSSESSDDNENLASLVLENKDLHFDENEAATAEQSIGGVCKTEFESGQKRKRKPKHRDSNFDWSVANASRKGAVLPSVSCSTKDASVNGVGYKKPVAEKEQNPTANKPASDSVDQEEYVNGSSVDSEDIHQSEDDEFVRELAEWKKRELLSFEERESAWAEEEEKIAQAKAEEKKRRERREKRELAEEREEKELALAEEKKRRELALAEEKKRRELALDMERRNTMELDPGNSEENMNGTQYKRYLNSNQNGGNRHDAAGSSSSSMRQNNSERNISQLRKQNVSQGNEEEEEEDQLKECRTYRPGKVLINDTFPEIWIKPVELTLLQRWKTKPKEMARRMLKILVGRKNLRDMCARGHSSKREPIPEDIVGCIEYYVNKKCPQGLSPAEFTTMANYMIGSIRHPKD